MEKEYTYGVARVRTLETGLLTDEAMTQLLSSKSFDEGMTFLQDRGWGSRTTENELEEMMEEEKQKTMKVLQDIVDDDSEYSILTIQDEYHNLKAAIKQACTGVNVAHVFIEGTKLVPDELMEKIREGKYESLPAEMQKVAKEATETLLRTGDGQLCDLIVDRATLQAIKKIGNQAENELIKKYADTQLTLANIKIAIRGVQAGKDEQFLEHAMVPCEGVSIDELKSASVGGVESIFSYLEGVGFGEGVKAFKTSPSVFECWCDNQIVELIRGEKYKSFGIGPIIAYAVARFNEIKTAKIILLGKQNGFEEEFIGERIRRMYA
jgi:V/A-type H+-transporting ATPase subunit C